MTVMVANSFDVPPGGFYWVDWTIVTTVVYDVTPGSRPYEWGDDGGDPGSCPVGP